MTQQRRSQFLATLGYQPLRANEQFSEALESSDSTVYVCGLDKGQLPWLKDLLIALHWQTDDESLSFVTEVPKEAKQALFFGQPGKGIVLPPLAQLSEAEGKRAAWEMLWKQL